MAASISPCGRAIVPVPAAPVVTPAPVFAPEPEDCAVPALLVPGDGGAASLDEFPVPPGSVPALCANALTGEIRIAIAATAAVIDDRLIGHLPLPFNDAIKSWFPAE
jgi:hypothetical protein